MFHNHVNQSSTGSFDWAAHDTAPIIMGSANYDGRERRQLLGAVGRDAGIWSRTTTGGGTRGGITAASAAAAAGGGVGGFPSTRDFFTVYRVLPYDLELVHDVADCRDLLMKRTKDLFKSLQQAPCYLDALSKPGCLDGLLCGVLHLVELLEHSENNRVAPDRNLSRRGWIQRLYLEMGVMDAAFCAVAALFDEPPRNITKERLTSILQQLKNSNKYKGNTTTGSNGRGASSSSSSLTGGSTPGIETSTNFEVSCPLKVIDRLRLAPGMVLLPHKPLSRSNNKNSSNNSSVRMSSLFNNVNANKSKSSSLANNQNQPLNNGNSALKGTSEAHVLKLLSPGCRIVEVDGMLSTTAFEACGKDDPTSLRNSSTSSSHSMDRNSSSSSSGSSGGGGVEWVNGGDVEQSFLAKAAVSAALKGRATLRLVVSRALCDEMLHVSAVSYNDPGESYTTSKTVPSPVSAGSTKVMRRTSLNMTMGAAFTGLPSSEHNTEENDDKEDGKNKNKSNFPFPFKKKNNQLHGLSEDVSSRIDAVRTLLMAVLRLASGFVQGGSEFQKHLRPYINFVSRFQGYKV